MNSALAFQVFQGHGRMMQDVYCLLQRKRHAFLVEAHIFGTALPGIFTNSVPHIAVDPPTFPCDEPQTFLGPPIKAGVMTGVGAEIQLEFVPSPTCQTTCA